MGFQVCDLNDKSLLEAMTLLFISGILYLYRFQILTITNKLSVSRGVLQLLQKNVAIDSFEKSQNNKRYLFF